MGQHALMDAPVLRLTGLCLCWLLVACSARVEPVAVPTQTLIVIPPSDTPSPITPTDPPVLGVLIPANAQPIVSRAQADLAAALNVPTEQIEITALDTAAWLDAELLDCDNSDVNGGTIDGYRIEFTVEGVVYTYHSNESSDFVRCTALPQVVERDPNAPLTEDEDTRALMAELGLDSDELFILFVDPVAAELTALARRLLANDLNVPLRQVRTLDVMPITWVDSSLGCPLPDQQYQPRRTEGYRIFLTVGDQRYLYHSDFERVIRCEPDNVVLPPEATPPATAEATPEDS